MKKITPIFIVLILILNKCYSQKPVLSTIAKGYISGQCGNLFMSATIGQAISGSSDCGPYNVIIGFQQPIDVVVTDVDDLDLSGIVLYPNPVIDYLHLKRNIDLSSQNLNIRIIDIIGNQHMNLQFDYFVNVYSIDVSSLPPGVFTLILSNRDNFFKSLLFTKI